LTHLFKNLDDNDDPEHTMTEEDTEEEQDVDSAVTDQEGINTVL